MSPSDDGYRNELVAAHARIEELERALNAQRNVDAKAVTLAALYPERARLSNNLRAEWKGTLATRVLVPLGIVSIVFAFKGEWGFSLAAIGFGIAIWFGTSALVRASRASAAQQLEAISHEIVALETDLGTKASNPRIAIGEIDAELGTETSDARTTREEERAR